MCKSKDGQASIGWPTPWNVDLTCPCVNIDFGITSGKSEFVKVSSFCLDWIHLSVEYIKVCIVLGLGDSPTLCEVNLVATTRPNNRRLDSSTLCTHALPLAHPRAISALRLQSLLFRHDFAFVLSYLSLLFMGHHQTLSVPDYSCRTLAQHITLWKKRVSQIKLHRSNFGHLISNSSKRDEWSSLRDTLKTWGPCGICGRSLEVLTLIGVGTFCARSISGCSSQLTFPVPRSFTQQFACESVNPGHQWIGHRCANTHTCKHDVRSSPNHIM